MFTGLKPHVQPEQLLGRTVALVYNLAPRAMKFGTSEGMILACGEEIPRPIFLDGCMPGDRIRENDEYARQRVPHAKNCTALCTATAYKLPELARAFHEAKRRVSFF